MSLCFHSHFSLSLLALTSRSHSHPHSHSHSRKADKTVNDGKSFLLVDGWLLKPFQAKAKVDSATGFYSAVTQRHQLERMIGDFVW